MTGLEIVNVVGVILSFVIMFVVVYKGMHVVWATIIASIVLVITNQLNLLDSISSLFSSWGDAIPTFAPIVLFGAVFSKMMDYTGAARSFAQTLYKYLVPKNAPIEKRRRYTIVVTIILEIVLVYAGFDQFAIVFLMLPILGAVCEEMGIPRRFIPAMILSAAGIACAAPGCANVSNTIPMQMAGSTSMGGTLPGFVGAAIIFVGVCSYLMRAVKKSVANGETFEWGPVLKPSLAGDNRPPFILSIIPIIVVIVAFNGFGLACEYAIALATIVGFIIMYKWLPIPDGQNKDVKGHFQRV